MAEALGITVGDKILRIYADGDNLVRVELWNTDEREGDHEVCPA